MTIYYTIYQTTNLLNGMIYIGMHQTDNLNDRYFGSGAEITRVLKEFGKKNFSREFLFIFNTFEEMTAKEKELVTPEFCLREDTYNIVNGGGGYGRAGIPVSEETRKKLSEARKRRVTSDETRQRLSIAGKGKPKSDEAKRNISIGKTGKKHSDEARRNMSISNKGRVPHNKGQPRSEETKRKIAETLKLRRLQNSDQTHSMLLE